MTDEVRLIDAVALEHIIQEQVGKSMIKVFNPSVNLILQDIRNAPTVEAEPVKHGRWKLRCYGDYPYCSNCNNEPKGREMTLYCPNCGSKQDLGGD